MSSTGRYKNINFKAHYGEILGFAAWSVRAAPNYSEAYSESTVKTREIYINGKMQHKNPVDAINNKIAF